MYNLQPCARRAHKHPIIDIYLPIVGRIYPIPEYICQLLAEYIPYQNISPIFGRIYLIPEYIQYQYTYIFNYSYIPQLLAVYIQYKYMK